MTEMPAMLPLFVPLVLLAAFLDFSVQPLASRLLLPETGGSSAAWTIGQLFFLGALLVGYLAALGLERRFGMARATDAAGAALVGWGALALLDDPLAIRLGPGPLELGALIGLALGAGLPVLALFCLSPLLGRRWAAVAPAAAYLLWVPSNLGSLGGLLAYPLLLEPLVDVSAQRWLWAAGSLLLGVGVLLLGRRLRAAPAAPHPEAEAASGDGSWRGWIGISTLAVGLSLALTNRLTLDVPAGPFVWVGPLAVFLAAYALAFSGRPRPAALARPLALPALLGLLVLGIAPARQPAALSFAAQLVLWAPLVTALAAALAARRPRGERIIEFSVATGLGGVLAGLLVGVLAPRLLDRPLEFELLALAAGLFLLGELRGHAYGARAALAIGASGLLLAVLARPEWALLAPAAALLALLARRPRLAPPLLAALVALTALLAPFDTAHALLHARSPFGAYRVRADGELRVFYHGSTVHGWARAAAAERAPVAYYWGLPALTGALRAEQGGTLRIGAVGLGVGTVARLADAGDRVRFWEIDPAVERIARDWFPYLREAPAGSVEVVIGDGRFALAAEPTGAYDLLLGDAYSSDAIPVHLLTLEGLREDARLLAPGGLLAVHVTNRHLDLARMLARAARELGWRTWRWSLPRSDDRIQAAAEWVILAPDATALDPAGAGLPGAVGRLRPDDGPAWTDERSPVLWALR